MYRTTVQDPRLKDTWKDHPPDILVSASPPVGSKGFIAGGFPHQHLLLRARERRAAESEGFRTREDTTVHVKAQKSDLKADAIKATSTVEPP